MFCKPCVCKFISIKLPHFDSHSCWVSPSTQMYVRLSISQVERAVKRLLLYRRAAEDMEPPALARTTSPNFSELMSDPSNAQQMQEDLADELTRCAHSCRKTGAHCHFASLACWIMLAYLCMESLTSAAGSCTCRIKMCTFLACSPLFRYASRKVGVALSTGICICLLAEVCIRGSSDSSSDTYTYS